MFKNLFGQLTPVTKNIIIINVVIYLLSNFIFPAMYDVLPAYFPLSPQFRSWQVITHMFMHARFNESMGVMHIVFNMLTLASFGPLLERFLGSKKFFWFYIISGLGSFVLYNLWTYYQLSSSLQLLESQGITLHQITNAWEEYELTNKASQLLDQPNVIEVIQVLNGQMLGASGAIFGIIAAFAVLYPDAEMFIMFIPFPIKAKVLFPIVIVGSLYFGITGTGGNIAHFAHLGGALVGFLLIKFWGRNRYRIN